MDTINKLKKIKESLKENYRFENRIPSPIINAGSLKTAINRAKKWLIQKVASKGIYEDFGQTVISTLKDKFIDISSYTDEMKMKRKMLSDFGDWCSSYRGNN